MKNKNLKILSIGFASAMFFVAGCSTAAAASTSYPPVMTQAIGRDEAAASGNAAFTTATGTSSAAATATSYDTAFSARDLSGEYDASEAVRIKLNGNSASCTAQGVSISGSTVTISAEGTYILSGKLTGSVIVDAAKEDKIQLVLNGAEIESDDFAAIYVKQADKVFVTLADGTTNSLSNGGTFIQVDDNEVDAVVFAKDDLTFNGTGSLSISSPGGHGISGKDEVTIASGSYEITASDHAIRAKDSLAIADGTFRISAGKDGLHAENGDDDTLGSIYITGGDFTIKVSDDAIHANTLLQIDGGTFNITGAEGLEATYIRINDGSVSITASDDGVNAASKSTAYTPAFEMNGGMLTIKMGSGDTDGVDSNGNLIINGGTIDVTGQSAFDYDGTATYNGGTIIINGQKSTGIPSQQMMGQRGAMGHGIETRGRTGIDLLLIDKNGKIKI